VRSGLDGLARAHRATAEGVLGLFARRQGERSLRRYRAGLQTARVRVDDHFPARLEWACLLSEHVVPEPLLRPTLHQTRELDVRLRDAARHCRLKLGVSVVAGGFLDAPLSSPFDLALHLAVASIKPALDAARLLGRRLFAAAATRRGDAEQHSDGGYC
jgi:hypothetical protein